MNSEFCLSSPNEDQRAAASVRSSEKKPRKKNATWQRSESEEDARRTTRDAEDDEDEQFSTSLSVGDGRYLVDLGSSSEFIVDEECILQLFKSCRECSKQCSVRKRVRGLKLVVYQTCRFCQSRCTWTNLLDGGGDDDNDDDNGCNDNSDLEINGRDAAHGQTHTAKSSSWSTN